MQILATPGKIHDTVANILCSSTIISFLLVHDMPDKTHIFYHRFLYYYFFLVDKVDIYIHTIILKGVRRRSKDLSKTY